MLPQLPASSLLSDGSDVAINGTTYRLKVLAGDDTRLRVPARRDALVSSDARRFDEALATLHELAQVVTRLNERLLDPLDGVTNGAVEALLTTPEVSDAFKDALRPWAFALFKHGSNVHTERGSVIVPPVPRVAFEREIRSMPAQRRGKVRWREFLDYVFDPVPLVTQGFYLFDRPQDKASFEVLLGTEYAALRRKLNRVFDEAIEEAGVLSERHWRKLDALSQQALTMQKEVLERALEAADPEVRAVTTRVRIRCYEGGAFRFLVRPYAYAFASELDRCARLLERARSHLPPHAYEAREVLADLADWCRERTHDAVWSECLPSWIEASDPASLIDVNFTTEEKVSRLGAKGGFQLAVTSFEPIPEAVQPVVELIRQPRDGAPKLNVVWLRHLIVGGGASNATLAGEKLPDPEGRPLYKVMTFTNAVRASMIQASAELITASTSFEPEDVERLGSAANVLVLLHELGHTFGDFAEFLGETGGSVEETNAEASVIYLSRRLAPDYLEDLVGLTACWTPVRRTMQGPTEPHSHSAIVLFDELARAGGVECVDLDGHCIVRPRSVEAAVHAAFDLAVRMRLWEIGIPLEHQAQWSAPFDADDREQDTRIVKRAREAFERLDGRERASWREGALRECRAFFAPARLEQLAEPLRRVIGHLPEFQPMTIIPTDDRFRLVLEVESTR